VVWHAINVFVAEHCETAAALQTGESEREFDLFGEDPAQRLAAYSRYCQEQIAYWTGTLDNPQIGPD
jgi:hypothetical protein